MRLALKHLPLEPWGNVRRDLHACCERVSTCAACRRRGSVRRDPDCPSCARTPIVAPFSPNDLRRTLPTLLRAQGIDPQLLAPLLGHADSRMVERVYGRIAPEQLGHLLELGARKYAAATRPKRRRAG
jgi:integrase